MIVVIDRNYVDVINQTEKGYLNYSDLNRIEDNILKIASLLDIKIESKKWNKEDLISKKDMERVLKNILDFHEFFGTPPKTAPLPKISKDFLNYANFNIIEENIFNTYIFVKNNLKNVLYTNEKFLGE